MPQATIKSIMIGESRNPGAVTIKRLCDGCGITPGDFFGTAGFNGLREIR